MKALLFLTGFFCLSGVQSQKLVKKALIDSETEFIQIDSQYCYEVRLSTAATNELKVEASIEGEYSKDLIITIEEKGATVLVSAGFHPNFANPNDKLSAHKVVSIALEISLPEYRDVYVYGTTSNIAAQGKYQKLKVKLSDGRCILDNVVETVEVNTQKGDILLTTSKGDITAKSIYGKVDLEVIPSGDYLFTLNTVEGKIHVKKTK